MLKVWRIKKTKQIVYPIGESPNKEYTLCLFPFGRESRRGHRGAVQSVRKDNLYEDGNI